MVRAEIIFIKPILIAAFDKSERCNNDVKFSEGDWMTASNLIKEEHLAFQRNGRVVGTLEISLELAFERLAKSQIVISSRFSYRTKVFLYLVDI